jgi:hypothetical protein
MTINILLDKAQKPDAGLVKGFLSTTGAFFEELCALTASCEQEWRHYGKKYGWKLKIHADDKTLLELTVAEGWFLVAMAIRGKELQDLKTDPAAAALADIADAGSSFPEGYGIKVEVRDQASFDRAKVLVRFIMSKRALV